MLTALYGEVLKNTELAEFALKTATPFITAIDEPIPPIKAVKYGRLLDIANYTAIGFVLGILFVCVRYAVRSIMKEQERA